MRAEAAGTAETIHRQAYAVEQARLARIDAEESFADAQEALAVILADNQRWILVSRDELAGWLHRSQEFRHGVALLTGTGIVPPNEFTLAAGDRVRIRIDGIGVLENSVAVV
jgi:2-dehydro-3-deoxy-D-arabinonate dehydratase